MRKHRVSSLFPLLLLSAALSLGAETTQPAEATQPAESTQPGGGEQPAESTQPSAGSAAAPDDLSAMPLLPASERTWTPETPVATILVALGEDAPAHQRTYTADQVQAGLEIFTTGFTTGPDGKRIRKQSGEFECSDCHNTVIEDPDLRVSDPEARLTFAEENDLPFLPGTTMYGQVDRTSWFNGDYVKKYGDLVKPANSSLVEAIQLCSVECSVGRELDEWEVDALLAFFWSIGLRWADLPETELTLPIAETAAMRGTEPQKEAALAQLRAAFLPASPATFGPKPEAYGRGEPGYGYEGDPDRGAIIYRRSCLHCHDKGGAAFHRFRDKACSYKTLHRDSGHKGIESYYHVVREGTKVAFGKYMPLFPLEKLSDEMVEDLSAWIEQQATTKKKRN